MIYDLLHIIAATATILLGLLAMIKPRMILGFAGLRADAGRGLSEIRAVLGGFFVALGATALFFQHPASYRTLGIGYLGIAVMRLVSMFVDQAIVASNVISLISEVVLAVLLLL